MPKEDEKRLKNLKENPPKICFRYVKQIANLVHVYFEVWNFDVKLQIFVHAEEEKKNIFLIKSGFRNERLRCFRA